MQATVPEAADISKESPETLQMYGANPGLSSFANNCLLARRLVEHGVRFVQLYDWGWDTHGTGPNDDIITQLTRKCRQTDRPIAALIQEWQPGTLVVGKPLHADGSDSDMTKDAQAFAKSLEEFGLPVTLTDERFSSIEAERQLKAARASGQRGRISKEDIDAAAAVTIAERYLAGAD